ncbi:MAG: OBG GTPase family GTP-binding protein [Candidatus Kariarchaeaceae archaeon]|jgi:ribosome-interacting GTPase 1
MPTAEERILEIEEEIKKTQYNKATQGHFATLKAQLSKLRNEILEQAQRSKAKKGTGFAIKKSGDATAILLGFPSVGKSTLLTAITNKDSKIGAFDFTTVDAIPGMMNYDGKYVGTKIQIIDLPGIIEDAARGKGRGREIFSAARNADLILIMLDAMRIDDHEVILNELVKANIRINQRPRKIVIKEKNRGGIIVTGHTMGLEFTSEQIQNVLREYRIINADVFINEPRVTLDEIIDTVSRNRIYVPSLTILNKVDLLDKGQLKEMKEKLGYFVPISADREWNLNTLKEAIVEKIDLMRVYLRRPGHKTDMEEPLIIKQGSSVKDVAERIHRRFINDFRHATIWGPSAKFPGQKVGLQHVLVDSDVVKIILKK